MESQSADMPAAGRLTFSGKAAVRPATLRQKFTVYGLFSLGGRRIETI
jgi:hypothetical protein